MQFELAIHDNRTSIVLSFYRTSIVLAHHLSISMSISRYLSVATYHSLSIYMYLYLSKYIIIMCVTISRYSNLARSQYGLPHPQPYARSTASYYNIQDPPTPLSLSLSLSLSPPVVAQPSPPYPVQRNCPQRGFPCSSPLISNLDINLHSCLRRHPLDRRNPRPT